MALTISCSPLVEGAWEGRLVHLAGLDVVGSTAGSLARLTQDREVELWEKRRIVRCILDGEVRFRHVWDPRAVLTLLSRRHPQTSP